MCNLQDYHEGCAHGSFTRDGKVLFHLPHYSTEYVTVNKNDHIWVAYFRVIH